MGENTLGLLEKFNLPRYAGRRSGADPATRGGIAHEPLKNLARSRIQPAINQSSVNIWSSPQAGHFSFACNQAWNINTFHKNNCQFLSPERCSDHFSRINRGSKNPSLCNLFSFSKFSAQSLKGPFSQEPRGTANPILGLSIICLGIYLYRICFSNHLPSPFLLFICNGIRKANSTTRRSREGTLASKLTPILARSTFVKRSSALSGFNEFENT